MPTDKFCSRLLWRVLATAMLIALVSCDPLQDQASGKQNDPAATQTQDHLVELADHPLTAAVDVPREEANITELLARKLPSSHGAQPSDGPKPRIAPNGTLVGFCYTCIWPKEFRTYAETIRIGAYFDAILRIPLSGSKAGEPAALHQRGLPGDCVEQSQFNDVADLGICGWTVQTSRHCSYRSAEPSWQNLFNTFGLSKASADNMEITHSHDSDSEPYGPIIGTFPSTDAHYTNVYNEKAIFAITNFGPEFMIQLTSGILPEPEANTRYPALHHWSDVVFLAYKGFCQQRGTSVRNLKVVVRSNVVNPDTQEIVQLVLDEIGRGAAPFDFFAEAPRIPADSDHGKAILGSPNGSGIAWMLAQHKAELGNKIVETIIPFTVEESRRGLNIAFVIEDLDEQQTG